MNKVLIAIVILALGVTVFLYMSSRDSAIQTKYDITLQEAQALLENPSIIILDVRSKKDLIQGRLRNAINIDVTQPEFQEALQKLDKTREYLVYCNLGRRSAQAIQEMEKAGFTKLYHIKEGIVKWKEAGLPIDIPIQP